MRSRTRSPAPARDRRSLTHVGGQTELRGERPLAEVLAHALNVATSVEDEEQSRAHVHGFHTYPARMHPLTAHRLIDVFSNPGERILDPFCGSGTVLVEALLSGRHAIGTDLNPIAVRLSRLKTHRHSAGELEELSHEAQAIAAYATERRTVRAGATRRYSSADRELFDPHVLLELDSLRAGILATQSACRPTLELILSSVLVKVSRKASDTSDHRGARRLAAGFTTKLFLRKTEELTQRLAAFAAELPKPPPTISVEVDDAAELRSVVPKSIDAVITSPPYAATYDYLAHHELRLRWLELETRGLRERELGARRSYASLSATNAKVRWLTEITRFLRPMARKIVRNGRVVLVIADSAVRGEALRADDMVAEAAHSAGFRLVAAASQSRPHFHRETSGAFRKVPRREHALLLSI